MGRKPLDTKEFLLVECTKKMKNLRHGFENQKPEVKKAMLTDPKCVFRETNENYIFDTLKWALDEFEQLSKIRSVNWGITFDVKELFLYEVFSCPKGTFKRNLIKYHCSERLNSNVEEEANTSTEEREAKTGAS
jgi:hypothetical protein